jgi:hypothetical protein
MDLLLIGKHGEMWGAEDAVLEPVFCDDASARQNKATQRTST